MFSSKPPSAPSLFEVTLGAILSVLLGGVLAASYLVAQPVETVKTLPKEPDADTVYYVVGSARSSLGRQWLRKKQVLVEQGAFEIELNEDELNTWVSSSQAAPNGEKEEAGIFVPKSLNFRLHEGELQIGMPCALSLAGVNRDVVVQARGTFVRRGDQFAYQPDQLYIGKLDVARLPAVGDLIWNQLVASQDFPEELVTGWKSLSQVAIAGNVLQLARR